MKIDLNKYGIGYKVFRLSKNGRLNAPMVETSLNQPLKTWLKAYAALPADKEKADKKQANIPAEMRHYHLSAKNQGLAFRPGWHLGDVPYATQFNLRTQDGKRTNIFPEDLVYVMAIYPKKLDKKAQSICNERMHYYHGKDGWKRIEGLNYAYGGYNHIPDGYYKFATNRAANPLEWIITSQFMGLKILTPEDVRNICKEHGLPIQPVGNKTTKANKNSWHILRPEEIRVTIRHKNVLTKTEKAIIETI